MATWLQIRKIPLITQLIDRVQALPPARRRLALPESDDPRVVAAGKILLQDNIIDQLWLAGSRQELSQRLEEWPVDFPGALRERLIFADETQLADGKLLADHLVAKFAAKARPLPKEKLDAMIACPLHQGGAALRAEAVAGMLAGAVFSTAEVIRATLNTVGLAPGIKTLSSSFLFCRQGANEDEEERFMFGDCGVVIDPTVEQLADIAFATGSTWQDLCGSDPVTSFLSFSTWGSANHPLSTKMQEATKLFKERYPERIAEGELQFDAAYVAEVGERKCPGNQTSGKSNCYIFPNLDAGNISYKITQRLAGFEAYGPILQGCGKRVCDLSRGAKTEDIAVMALITLLKS